MLRGDRLRVIRDPRARNPIFYRGKPREDFVVVPGLAFDRNRYRLGYGGGYYDNFLMTQPKAQKVGIFYPFQEVVQVPKEAHDVQLDEMVVGELR
jgi:5,10-methenyltetrahydrofolate synthetase